jgi:hypothetical protein
VTAPTKHRPATPESGISRPAWLLALVAALFVSALVFLEYAQRPVVNLMALAVPTLAALYVVSRVEKRSDDQDAALEDHAAKLTTIEKATNGDLTRRLNEAVQPIHDELQLLREALARNHPDDPLAVATQDVTDAVQT